MAGAARKNGKHAFVFAFSINDNVVGTCQQIGECVFLTCGGFFCDLVKGRDEVGQDGKQKGN